MTSSNNAATQIIDELLSILTNIKGTTTTNCNTLKKSVLNIIHFNDVYNITEGNNKDRCGGAARFMTIMEKLKSLKPSPLVFFSGDFLSPSNISTVTKGEHMISIMNEFGINCGMIGNHDLDFGDEHCCKCLKLLNYPTLNTNIFTPKQENSECKQSQVYHNDANLRPLGDCKTELIFQNNGLKIGIIGVSENWCNTLSVQPTNGIIYKDFIAETEKYVNRLKSEHSLDVMIVLTHSRKQNDILLANKVKGMDLILGGHDHLYHVEMNKINQSLLVKSGCDFKGITLIQLYGDKVPENEPIISELNGLCLKDEHKNLQGLNYNFNTFHYNINDKLAPHPKMKSIVDELSNKFLTQISKPIGYINCNLDTRFKIIRKYESAACNLICDIVRNAYKCKCDIVILCGGGIRSDKIHEKGIITFKDILDLVPFQDPVIVKKMSGKNIIKAIKHSIVNLPKLDGRFAHVSGMKYSYDSRKEPEHRLINVKVSSKSKDEKKGQEKFIDIEEDKYYTVASREYTMNGGDGFESFKDAENETIVDDESGVSLSQILRNFFWTIETINDAVKLLMNKKSLNGGQKKEKYVENLEKLIQSMGVGQNGKSVVYDDGGDNNNNQENVDKKLFKIEPQIEGRIVDIADMEDKECDDVENESKIFLSSPSPRYDKLPPYAHMTEKPKHKQSIINFIAKIGD